MSTFKLKKRRHGRRKSNKQFIIISVCLVVFVFILGTAYSAFSTNLSINASGEIIERTYTINDLKSLVVTSGDGLYQDSYEDGRYIYRGGDPDNYILLGDDLFRIIAIESDGTLKVISNESIGSMVFDPGYSTSIDGVTEASSTDGTRYTSDSSDYCYFSTSSSFYGCNAWGSKTTTLNSSGENVGTMPKPVGGTEYELPDTEAYINAYLNGIYYGNLSVNVQGMIEPHIFNIGPIKYSSGQTLKEDIEQEQAYKWKGNVGLANVTDYVKATTIDCSVATYHYNSACHTTAITDNWMHSDDDNWWFISAYSQSAPNNVFVLGTQSDVSNNIAFRTYDVYPVFYLSSDIVLKNKGTYDSPYEIVS